MESLKLTDAKEIDTSMGKKYINKVNEDDQWPDDDLFYIDLRPGNIVKIEETNDIFDALHDKVGVEMAPQCYVKSKGDIIAEKIEENTEMFVQLEYLLRGTDPRDVRDGHLKLMSQMAQCGTSKCRVMWSIIPVYPTMLFTENTPLYNLAFVFWDLNYDPLNPKSNIPMIMINDKKLKPLCKFFVKICRDAGLDVALVYTSRSLNIEHLEKDFSLLIHGKYARSCLIIGFKVAFSVPRENKYFPALGQERIFSEPSNNMGCTGVVVERADLDSAIDCFINSSISAPWRFKHIYVQESIFMEFVETLRAKSVGAASAGRVCVGDKTFLLEGERGEGLPASAFRSTRELLDLIDTSYLSLWAAETALSHEIALRAPSCTIWINDYASFYGPPRSALSVFNIHATVSLPCPDMKDILAKWSNLKPEERFDVMETAFTSSDIEYFSKYCLPFLKESRNDSLLEITDKTICFGIQKHLGLIADRSFFGLNCFERRQLVLKGTGLYNYGSCSKLAEEFQKFGIPVATSGTFSNINLPYPMLLERLKVIRTNYGTIFAN